MRKYLVFWVVVLFGVMSVGLLVSCRDDVIVPSPPSLVGNYKGDYTLRKHVADQDPTTDTTRVQLVTFRFTSANFAMSMDTSVAETDRIFCDVLGEYELKTGVTLTVIDSNTTRALCTEMWAPTGSYSLDQTTDITKLTRIYTDGDATMTAEFKLRLQQAQ